MLLHHGGPFSFMHFTKRILFWSLLFLPSFFATAAPQISKPTLNVMTYLGLLDKTIVSKFEEENRVNLRVEFMTNSLDFSARIKSHMRAYDVMIANQQVLDSFVQSNIVHNTIPLWKDPIGIAYDSRVSKFEKPVSWTHLISPDENPYWRQRVFASGLSPREDLMIALLVTNEKLSSLKSKTPSKTQVFMDALKQQSITFSYPTELAFLGNNISAAVVFYSDFLRMKKTVPFLDFRIPQEGTFYTTIGAACVGSSFQENLSKKFVAFLNEHRRELSQKNHLADFDSTMFNQTQVTNWEPYDEYGFILRRSNLESP